MKDQTTDKKKESDDVKEIFCVEVDARSYLYQNWGVPTEGKPVIPPFIALQASQALKKYKDTRGQRIPEDKQRSFPSGGFENLKIKSYAYSTIDPQNIVEGPANVHYRWRLTLEDGSIREDFYCTIDQNRGWPDKNDPCCYWFIVHGPNDVKIEGFSLQTNSPPSHWCTLRYTECGAIQEWMEEKDRNRTTRLERENISPQSSQATPIETPPLLITPGRRALPLSSSHSNSTSEGDQSLTTHRRQRRRIIGSSHFFLSTPPEKADIPPHPGQTSKRDSPFFHPYSS